MHFRYQSGQQLADVTLERAGDGYQAVIDGQAYAVEVIDQQPGILSLRISGRPMTFYWAQDGSRKWISQGGCTYWLDPPARRGSHPFGEVDGSTAVRSPMPAQVRAVQVASGDPVERGQVLMLLEAMKMENEIKSPYEGKVKKILVREKQTVDKDQVLLVLE